MCVGSFFLGVLSVIAASAFVMLLLMRFAKTADEAYDEHFPQSNDDWLEAYKELHDDEHATQHYGRRSTDTRPDSDGGVKHISIDRWQ